MLRLLKHTCGLKCTSETAVCPTQEKKTHPELCGPGMCHPRLLGGIRQLVDGDECKLALGAPTTAHARAVAGKVGQLLPDCDCGEGHLLHFWEQAEGILVAVLRPFLPVVVVVCVITSLTAIVVASRALLAPIGYQ